MVYLILLAFTLGFALTILKAILSGLTAVFKPSDDSLLGDEENAVKTQINGLYADLEFYAAKLANLEELQRLTEQSYQAAVNVNKQAALLRKMITLDNQIHDTEKRIAALETALLELGEELPP